MPIIDDDVICGVNVSYQVGMSHLKNNIYFRNFYFENTKEVFIFETRTCFPIWLFAKFADQQTSRRRACVASWKDGRQTQT